MKLTQQQYDSLKKLSEKNQDVKKLLEFYDYVTNHSVYDAYVARKVTLSNWNADLINSPVRLFSKDDADEEKAKSRDKEVDRVLKFLEKQPDLVSGLEDMGAKLTPEEKDAVNRDTRIKEGSDRAFKGIKT